MLRINPSPFYTLIYSVMNWTLDKEIRLYLQYLRDVIITQSDKEADQDISNDDGFVGAPLSLCHSRDSRSSFSIRSRRSVGVQHCTFGRSGVDLSMPTMLSNHPQEEGFASLVYDYVRDDLPHRCPSQIWRFNHISLALCMFCH